MTSIGSLITRRTAGCFALVLGLLASNVQAQDPAHAPAVDSAQVQAPDSTAAQDSLPPLRVFPAMHTYESTNPAAGVWVFDRDTLRNVGVVTLGDLLQLVPGAFTIRGGYYAQPEIVTTMGLTAGRIEVLLDGFVLDPLVAGTPDLSRIELVNVRRIVVERRLDLLRINLETLEPFDRRPFASVEAGVAEPQSRLFRGLFMTPSVFHGPLAIGVERLDTDGARRAEDANTFAGWLKYALVFGRTGVQAEVRRTNIVRNPTESGLTDFIPVSVIGPGRGDRTDIVLRARSSFTEQLTGELFYGRSSVRDSLGLVLPDPQATDSTPLERRRERETQAGARLGLHMHSGFAEAAFRWRDDPRHPKTETDVSASLHPVGAVEVGGGATFAQLHDGNSALSYVARASVSPLRFLTAFGEFAGGKRAVPVFGNCLDSVEPECPSEDSHEAHEAVTERTAFRAGAAIQRGRLRVSGALLKLKQDSVPPFGLPFDSTFHMFPGPDITGWEANGAVPLYFRWLSAEGSIQTFTSGLTGIYLPDRVWRAGLIVHTSPLRSGNLEIFARAQARYRGPMTMPDLSADDAHAGSFVTVPETTAYDFDLHIRIEDFRIFFRSEDFLNKEDNADVPGRPIPGPRLYYGIRWQFWN